MNSRSFLITFSVVLLFASCKNQATSKEVDISKASTTYYLIRHAEKDRTDSTESDPTLTNMGFKRAQYWAQYFDSIPLNEIYSTNYKRTLQTIAVVANQKKKEVKVYDPKSLINGDFLEKTKDQRVLICGHSNTTPQLVNQLMKEELYPDMHDNDNSSLYVVTFRKGGGSAEIKTVALPLN